jgi:hypothetical protein
LETLLRRPRNTAKLPANSVKPAMAEAGSISGALTGVGLNEGKQISIPKMLKHWVPVPEADATPAMDMSTSAKLIFLIMVLP